MTCRLFLFSLLFCGIATSCVSDRRLRAHDHGSLFWSGRVNIDPRSAARRAVREDQKVTWRPGIEIEANVVNDLARKTDGSGRVDDYTSAIGTVAWSPEIWVHDIVGVGAQVGIGGHDSKIARDFSGTRDTASESGLGLFAAAQVSVKPLSFLQAYGRASTYEADDLSSRFVEVGLKLGLHDSAWLFAAWRRADLTHELAPPFFLPDFERIHVETDGIALGVELRF